MIKYFLDKGLIWTFLLLFLISLILPGYFLWRHQAGEIEEEETLLLDEDKYDLFLENLESQEPVLFRKNPFID